MLMDGRFMPQKQFSIIAPTKKLVHGKLQKDVMVCPVHDSAHFVVQEQNICSLGYAIGLEFFYFFSWSYEIFK